MRNCSCVFILGVSLIWLGLPASLVSAETKVAKTYEEVKVAEGVYAFIADEPKSEIVSGNSVAVIGDDGVLVVDSGHFPSLTRKMIADIRQVTDKPVRFLINTHWHPDHLMGNYVYREAFPGVVIISTPSTREQANKQVPTIYMKEMMAQIPAHSEKLQQRLQTGKKKDGSPLTAWDKWRYQDLLDDCQFFLPELQQAKYEPPSETYDHSVTVYLGKRQVDVMFLGRGNTGGDTVIYVPDAKVLMTGDLVVNPTPYSYGSFLTEWVETLKKLEAIDATTIVPGHGPVEHDKEYIKLVRSLLESTTSQVQQAVQAGLSLEDTRNKVDLESFRKQFAGDNVRWNADFQEGFVVPAVGRAYREAKEGKLHDED
jgi:cyclase